MEILFCIPGGGTSSLMYMGWQKLLKDEFTIIPLEIPGRGRLREMERASSLEEIAEGMARQVCEQANGRSYGIRDLQDSGGGRKMSAGGSLSLWNISSF